MTRIVRCTHEKPAGADICFGCIMRNTVNALYAKAPLTGPFVLDEINVIDEDGPVTEGHWRFVNGR